MYTPADFKADFPQFTTIDDAIIQRQINNAAPFFDVARWAAFYSAGIGNYVAHMLTLNTYLATLSASQNMGIDVVMKKVGDVTIQKDAGLLNASAKDPFNRTIYGQEYARLRKMIGSGGLAV